MNRKHKNNNKVKSGWERAKTITNKGHNFSSPSWILILLLAFTAFLYFRALQNGFVSFDDDKYVTSNTDIIKMNWENIGKIFSTPYVGTYAPLTMLLFMLEVAAFKLNPLAFHLINILLHLLNSWLVYKLVQRLSSNKFTAILVMFFFAIHPMHVESVVWISELKDMLYTVFFLLSSIVYLDYIDSGRYLKKYAGAFLLFIASLLSKSAAVSLPVLLLLFDYYKGRKMNMGVLLEKIPFFILSVIFGIITLHTQNTEDFGGAITFSYTFIERIFMFTYAIAFYLIKLVAPFNLSVLHFYPIVQNGLLPWYYYASFPFLLLLAGSLVIKTSFRKEMLFGISFFLITISVMLQIIPTGHAITAERYTYVSYIGLLFIAGQWMSRIKRRQIKNLAIAGTVIWGFLFSIITWQRIGIWHDSNSLFTDVINKYPGHFLGYLKRGDCKSDQNDYTGAIDDYTKAIALNPEAFKAYNNRANAYNFLGNKQAALLDFDKCLQIDPKSVQVYMNRAQLKKNLGDNAGALMDANTGISLLPGDAEAYLIRGKIKNNLKDYKNAIDDFDSSIKLNSSINQTFFYRGISYLNLHDTVSACKDWEKASSLGYKGAEQIIKQYCK